MLYLSIVSGRPPSPNAVKAPVIEPPFTHWVTRWHLVLFPPLITFHEPFSLVQCVTWRQGQKWFMGQKKGKKTWINTDQHGSNYHMKLRFQLHQAQSLSSKNRVQTLAAVETGGPFPGSTGQPNLCTKQPWVAEVDLQVVAECQQLVEPRPMVVSNSKGPKILGFPSISGRIRLNDLWLKP